MNENNRVDHEDIDEDDDIDDTFERYLECVCRKKYHLSEAETLRREHLRLTINRLVRHFVMSTGFSYNYVWSMLLEELRGQTDFDAKSKRNEDCKAVDAVECKGLLDELYRIADKRLICEM